MMKMFSIFVLLALGTVTGCSSHDHAQSFGQIPRAPHNTIPKSKFDLYHIQSIVFYFNNEPIASLDPMNIIQGTNNPDQQLASFDLTYLDDDPLNAMLSKDDTLLVIDRLTPKSKDDRRLKLNPNASIMNIGGFDHTIIIDQSEETNSSYNWTYYSGAGPRCSGKIGFIFRKSP